MINKITSHIPVLMVVLPMLAIFLVAAIRGANYISKIAFISSSINLGLSVILLDNLIETHLVSYALGNWQPPIGIEFRVDYLNAPLIFLINLMFFLAFSFGAKLLETQIFSTVPAAKLWIVYSLFFLSQIGLLGITSTGDLFNLYVFIEILSLSTYALLSLGKDKRAVVGGFHYLVMGTIGATFILIGVGLILSLTGSLNMANVKQLSQNLYENKAFLVGVAFYLAGSLLKVALIPLHSWMVKTYEYAPSSLITFLAGISNFVGFYIILRFIYSVLDYKILFSQLNIGLIFEILGVISILAGSILAYTQTSMRKIFIFSSLTHIGYITLSLSLASADALKLTFVYLVTDVLLKTALFCAVAILEGLKGSTELDNLKGIVVSYPRFTWLLGANIITNATLPPTMHFFNKLNLMSTLVDKQRIVTFVCIIFASLLGLLYNYKIINKIFFHDGQRIVNPFKAKPIDKTSKILFYALSSISTMLVIFYGTLNDYADLITNSIF
jgi:multicomponent Na+:H+ antiporter subunit D